MIIGVDASRSVDAIQKTGVEKVSDGIIRALLEKSFKSQDSDFEFVFYAPREIDWIPKCSQRIFGPGILWTIVGLSWKMLTDKPDVLFVPVHILPFFCPKRTFRIIHDIASIKNPKLYDVFQRAIMRFDVWRSARICEKIFVSTQSVKEDLLRFTKVRDKQVIVTGFGYVRNGKPQTENRKIKRKKQLLYIGRVEEKKNIRNLINGFKLFLTTHPDYTLVLVGKPGKGFQNFQFSITNSQNIEYKGFVRNEEKYTLLSESAALIHVPLEEGFSFPLLEAFDFNLPVIASDIPALRDVAGNGAEFVNADDVESIARGISKVIDNPVYSEELTQNGYNRLNVYSWDSVANIVVSELTGD